MGRKLQKCESRAEKQAAPATRSSTQKSTQGRDVCVDGPGCYDLMSLSCLVPSPEPTGHCFQDHLQVSNPQKLQYLHRAYAHPVIGWKSTLDGVAHPRQRRCHAPSGHTRLHRKQWQERQVWMCSVQTLLLKHFFFLNLEGREIETFCHPLVHSPNTHKSLARLGRVETGAGNSIQGRDPST